MRVILSLLAASLAASAIHAAPACQIPNNLTAPHTEKAGESRQAPTGGYLLSLIWSPESCFTSLRHPHNKDDYARQCGAGQKRGFILHGLWPDGVKDNAWPQYCKQVPPVSLATVKSMICRNPSVSLIEHEWEKHGSCGWNNAEAYFSQSAKLYDALNLPMLEGLTRGQVNVSAVRAAFHNANPSIAYKAIAVVENKGKWLNEIRLCLDTQFHPHDCPAFSAGAPDGAEIKVARVKN
jgi:ribonuclease T2